MGCSCMAVDPTRHPGAQDGRAEHTASEARAARARTRTPLQSGANIAVKCRSTLGAFVMR